MTLDLRALPQARDRLSYLYVEHANVEREEGSVAFLATDEEGEPCSTPAPVCDLALLMLGPGTTLSHAAASVLARNNCLVAWVGEEGVRLYAFGSGGARSSARLLRQAALAVDPSPRQETVRRLYGMRFPEGAPADASIAQLRGREGIRVREAYRRLAEAHGIDWPGRAFEAGDTRTGAPINRALSAANACLYGVCHAAILSLGLSPGLGFIHTGQQLSFVYDVADLYKLDLAAPTAFAAAAEGAENIERRVRRALRDRFRETRFVARVADDLMGIVGPDDEGAAAPEGDEGPVSEGGEAWTS